MARPYGWGGTSALKNTAQAQSASNAAAKAQAAQGRAVAQSHEAQARKKVRPKKGPASQGKQPSRRSKTPGTSPDVTVSGRDQSLLAQGYTPGEIVAANAQAGLQYGPAIAQTKQTIQNVEPWFNDYRAAITGSQGQVNQLSDPAIAQAYQRAQGTGQTVLGPGASPEAMNNDALAAAARQGLGNASAQALQSQNLADNSYFSKLGANSQLQQIGASTALSNQLGTQRTQQANAKVNALSTLHQQNLTNALEQATLLTNTQQKQLQAKLGYKTDLAKIKATSNTADAKFVAQYGVSQNVYRNMTPKERLAWKKQWNKSSQSPSDKLTTARLKYFQQHGYFPRTGKAPASNGSSGSNGLTPAQRHADRRDSRKAISHLQEVPGIYHNLSQQRNPKIDPTTNKPVVHNGKVVTVAPTDAQIKAELQKRGYSPQEIDIALTLNKHRPLTPAQVRAARNLGIKVPKRWLPKHVNRHGGKPSTGAGGYPSGKGSGSVH